MRDAVLDSPRATGRNAARPRSSAAPSLDGLTDDRPVGRGSKSASVRVGGALTSAAIAAQRLGGRRASAASAVRQARQAPGFVARLRNRLPRVRPFKILTISVFSMALVGIVANAMVFQRGHHPAPLFGLGQSIDGVPDAAPKAGPPMPPSAPVERTGAIPPAPDAPPAPPAVTAAPPKPATAKPTAPKHAVAKPRHEDAIGGLLQTDGAAAKPHPPAHAHRAKAESTDPSDHPNHAKTVAAHPRPHAAIKTADGDGAAAKTVPKAR